MSRSTGSTEFVERQALDLLDRRAAGLEQSAKNLRLEMRRERAAPAGGRHGQGRQTKKAKAVAAIEGDHVPREACVRAHRDIPAVGDSEEAAPRQSHTIQQQRGQADAGVIVAEVELLDQPRPALL